MGETDSIKHGIVRLFASRMNLQVPSSDTDLFETGVLDSLTFVELLLLLEQEFGVKTSLEDLEFENFRSIEKIAVFVLGHYRPLKLSA
jgi:acyl carrier protein